MGREGTNLRIFAKDRKLQALTSIFNHTSFRGKQEQAIDVILEGKNCLLVLPTGAGKTICFAIPALITGGVTVVVCPLLSLMLDQVNRLRAKGLNVCYINSDFPSAERDVLVHNLLLDSPPYNFLFVTPESTISPEMEEIFSTMELKKKHSASLSLMSATALTCGGLTLDLLMLILDICQDSSVL